MPKLKDTAFHIITDLDGSLLDHETYCWDAAQSWLDTLKFNHVPIIFCTSKTVAETLKLQEELGIDQPFICENGAVVYTPSTKTSLLGKSYQDILEIIHNIRKAYHFKFSGFADANLTTIQTWTGLHAADAYLAQQRHASEPILWQDNHQNLKLFASILKRQHLKLIQGGRFWHVVSENIDKRTALQWLLKDQKTTTIGLGDGPNDKDFLEFTQLSIVIKSYSPKKIKLHKDPASVYYTKNYGPAGWSEGLDYFLQQ